ncbi:MAG: hypothetical protein K8I82_19740 [Anaerolineae bacterium]|nr:hypothetical protein [Anaerolineae bacterium]
MPRLSPNPETEIIGQVLAAYVDDLRSESRGTVLDVYQVSEINPQAWYPAMPWLDYLYSLASQTGFSTMMVAVGLKVAETARMPPEMRGISLGEILMMWNTHYHANHRYGEIGEIFTEKVNEKYYRTIHNHLYPDDMNYGIAYGFARVFSPAGTRVSVWYENPDHRLDKGGGDETIISVRWE